MVCILDFLSLCAVSEFFDAKQKAKTGFQNKPSQLTNPPQKNYSHLPDECEH